MNTACIMYGAIIAVVVSLAKRIPFVRNHPKIIAAVLASAIAAYRVVHPDAGAIDFSALAECVAVQFSSAVAVHETALKPIREAVNNAISA